MNNSKDKIQSYVSFPDSLISFMEHSDSHWAIKDTESNYIFMNKNDLEYCNIPKNFNIEGKSDTEIPTKICEELGQDFIKDDQKVINEKKKIITLEIHYYGKGNIDNLVPHICEKSPLYDNENKIIGVICYGRSIENPQLLYYINRLNRKTIQFDAPNDLFTKRELEVAFWLQQKLKSKEIAKRLCVSYRTVENRLLGMYQKAGVNNSNQFIEYCQTTGLDQYIPSGFIRKGVQLIE